MSCRVLVVRAGECAYIPFGAVSKATHITSVPTAVPREMKSSFLVFVCLLLEKKTGQGAIRHFDKIYGHYFPASGSIMHFHSGCDCETLPFAAQLSSVLCAALASFAKFVCVFRLLWQKLRHIFRSVESLRKRLVTLLMYSAYRPPPWRFSWFF